MDAPVYVPLVGEPGWKGGGFPLAGHMEKKGAHPGAGFKRRFFQLDDSKLRWAVEAGSGTKGFVDLVICQTVRLSQVDGAPIGEIEIVTPARTYRLRCQNRETAECWISGLQRLMISEAVPPESWADAGYISAVCSSPSIRGDWPPTQSLTTPLEAAQRRLTFSLALAHPPVGVRTDSHDIDPSPHTQTPDDVLNAIGELLEVRGRRTLLERALDAVGLEPEAEIVEGHLTRLGISGEASCGEKMEMLGWMWLKRDASIGMLQGQWEALLADVTVSRSKRDAGRGADDHSDRVESCMQVLPAAANLLGAVRLQDSQTVSDLLALGASPDGSDHDGETALHMLAAMEQVDHSAIVSTLLRAGASTESRTKNGQTPIMRAAYHGCACMVVQLFRAGADLRAKDLRQMDPRGWAGAEMPPVPVTSAGESRMNGAKKVKLDFAVNMAASLSQHTVGSEPGGRRIYGLSPRAADLKHTVEDTVLTIQEDGTMRRVLDIDDPQGPLREGKLLCIQLFEEFERLRLLNSKGREAKAKLKAATNQEARDYNRGRIAELKREIEQLKQHHREVMGIPAAADPEVQAEQAEQAEPAVGVRGESIEPAEPPPEL